MQYNLVLFSGSKYELIFIITSTVTFQIVDRSRNFQIFKIMISKLSNHILYQPYLDHIIYYPILPNTTTNTTITTTTKITNTYFLILVI